jgi:chromosome segregation ATPase
MPSLAPGLCGEWISSITRVWAEVELREKDLANAAATIVELQRIANERLLALQEADKALRSTTLEAEKRERGLHELSAIITARDARILELEQVATERLTALEKTDAAFREISREAEARESGLHELTAMIHARDARILELEQVATERLTALETTDQALRAISREAEAREAGLHELTAVIHARDARIAQVEGDLRSALMDSERLRTQLLTVEAELSDSRIREDALGKQIVEFENQSLLKFISRRSRGTRPLRTRD